MTPVTDTERARREDAIRRIKKRVLTGADLLREYEELYEENIWVGLTPVVAHLCAVEEVNDRTERLRKKRKGR